jgi:hypothetical protein
MMNNWYIEENGAKNGMHLLIIEIEGEKVEQYQSGSLRFLSSIANQRYKVAFNKHTLSNWRYTI